jgi:Domain of unknown function (DUF4190)
MTSGTITVPPRLSGRAIGSVLCGLAGCVVPIVPSVLAIWLGVSAQRRIEMDPSLRGGALAAAGAILGWLGLLLWFLAAIVIAFLVTPGTGAPA